MDHARRIITKNRMRASIFVIRLWFQNGQSRPPAEYEKAKCGVVCYGELNIIMRTATFYPTRRCLGDHMQANMRNTSTIGRFSFMCCYPAAPFM